MLKDREASRWRAWVAKEGMERARGLFNFLVPFFVCFCSSPASQSHIDVQLHFPDFPNFFHPPRFFKFLVSFPNPFPFSLSQSRFFIILVPFIPLFLLHISIGTFPFLSDFSHGLSSFPLSFSFQSHISLLFVSLSSSSSYLSFPSSIFLSSLFAYHLNSKLRPKYYLLLSHNISLFYVYSRALTFTGLVKAPSNLFLQPYTTQVFIPLSYHFQVFLFSLFVRSISTLSQ